MKIALIGYGKMGRAIESAAIKRGHEIIVKIDIENLNEIGSARFKEADVALEFTTPPTAESNIRACFDAGVPVVSGTTGWTDKLEELKKICSEKDQTFFYASNFSIGVNILFKLNSWLAEVMNKFNNYDVEIREIHHIHKKDAPSGTAITLAEGLIDKFERKSTWENSETTEPETIPVLSERRGEVPGTHVITWKSDLDVLEIEHKALNRSIFASGAVLAAEFIDGKKGVFTMDDLMDI